MYNFDAGSQIQNLQNQIAQLAQLYNNPVQPTQQIAAAPTRQVPSVQGWRGAEDFRLLPGESVLLNDSDAPLIYFKICDANGVTKLRALEFNDVTERFTNPAPLTENFVTKNEFNEFKSELKAIINEYARDFTASKGDKTE